MYRTRTHRTTQCLFCLNGSDRSTFQNEAHVLPKFLGTFDPDIFFQGDMVCDRCDNELSRVERKLAHDSAEGLVASLYGRKEKPIIEFHAKSLKLNFKCTLQTTFSPLLLLLKGIYPKNTQRGMICIQAQDGRCVLIPIGLVERLSEGETKRQGKRLDIFRGKPYVCDIIGEEEDVTERGQKILQRFGLTYDKVSDVTLPTREQIVCEVEFDQRMELPIARALAKIAFSYFAYCAKDGYRDVIFAEEFDPIRQFIREGSGYPTKFLEIERGRRITIQGGKPSDYYTLAFHCERGEIIVAISLLGFVGYRISLAPYKFSSAFISSKRFGSGHSFNLKSGEINRLHASRIPVFHKPFGLFHRG